MAVIEMVQITITSFHINLESNKSYLIDDYPQESMDILPNSKSWKYTAVDELTCTIRPSKPELSKFPFNWATRDH